MVTAITKSIRHFPPLAIVDGISARKLVDFISVAGIGIADGVEKFFVVGSYHFMNSNANRKVGTYKEKIICTSHFMPKSPFFESYRISIHF